jgi:hypothetical protein
LPATSRAGTAACTSRPSRSTLTCVVTGRQRA